MQAYQIVGHGPPAALEGTVSATAESASRRATLSVSGRRMEASLLTCRWRRARPAIFLGEIADGQGIELLGRGATVEMHVDGDVEFTGRRRGRRRTTP